MSYLEQMATPAVHYALERAARLASELPSASMRLEHLLGAMLEMSAGGDRQFQYRNLPALNLLKAAGLKWDVETRRYLGVISPEDKTETAERAELARLKAKYEGGTA